MNLINILWILIYFIRFFVHTLITLLLKDTDLISLCFKRNKYIPLEYSIYVVYLMFAFAYK